MKHRSQVLTATSPDHPRVPHKRRSSVFRWLPNYAWQRLTRNLPRGRVHLILAMADHFEPAIVPGDGQARTTHDEQQRRVDSWCREYPRTADAWRDNEGRPFVHTYFYPAEQYSKGIIQCMAEHCHAGWGEIEIHLHHGVLEPDTAENTRRLLLEFRDTLAIEHGCLSYMDNLGTPRYAFVHGNFALANSAGGLACGVDSEMHVLAETGCYADMTLPTAAFHPAQTRKINSLYECSLPLTHRAPQRRGCNLKVRRAPRIFPLIIQGPLMLDRSRATNSRIVLIDNGAMTRAQPPTLHRLRLWKQAAISVNGRPEWIFIKLHCHGMDPTQEDSVLGTSMRHFLRELVEGAPERDEVLHFVTAREMVNIVLAACDGREGNPGEFRDYRLNKGKSSAGKHGAEKTALKH